MADLLNTNIKKNLVQTKVTTKQNSTTAKTASTAQTTAVKSTTKLTSTQVNAGIASGTLSASKAISTLKSDLSANVTTTKTANNKTVAQTTVGGKAITINTNAKDVPITTASSAIATAKTISINTKESIAPIVKNESLSNTYSVSKNGVTGIPSNSINILNFETFYATYKDIFSGISMQELKDIYNVMSSISKGEVPSTASCDRLVNIINKMSDESINAFFEYSCGNSSANSSRNAAPRRAPSANEGEPAVGSHGEYGGDGWFGDYGTDGFVGLGACIAHQWGIHGGMENWTGSGAEEMNLGVLLGALIEWTCLNTAHGVLYLSEVLPREIEQLGQNVADKFVIHDYSQGKTNDTNNSTGGSGSDNYAKGGTDTKEPTVTFNDDGSLSTWSKGFGQYGGSTVDTGNGTSVEFGPVTAIGTSENDSGGYNGIYTDGNGDVVAVSGSNGNGEKNLDGIGDVNNHKPGDDWTDSNGTKHHMNDDGSVTSTYKNGKTIIYYPDGTEEIIDSNSTSDDVEGNESAEDSEKVEDEEDENDKKDKKSDSDGNKKSGGGGGGYTAGMSSAGTAFDNFTKDLAHSGMSYLQYQMKKSSSSANDFADNWGSGNNTTMRHA